MKKLMYLIIAITVLGLIVAGCTTSVAPPTEQKYNDNNPNLNVFEPGDLVAGQNINVGIVSVWNDDTDLCVEYVLSADAINDGWFLTETHWAVATDIDDIPQKNGNPIPGQFLYGDDSLLGEMSSYQECIPLSALSALELGGNIYIAAHAVVQKQIGTDEEGQPIFQTESAWAAGYEFYGKNWATYFGYCYGAGVVDPEASGATFVDNEDRTGTMTLTVLDYCGNGIEGLELADIVLDIQWVVGLTDLFTLSAGGYWDIVLVENGNGIYEITFHRTGSVPYTRLWDVIVMDKTIEDDLPVAITNFLEAEAELESVVYEGACDNTFGTQAGETMTFTFSNDVVLSPTPIVYFDGGIPAIGTGPLNWTAEGKEVVITTTGIFSTPRPEVGDIVTGLAGIVDVLDNEVIVPIGGVEIEGIVFNGSVTGQITADEFGVVNGTLNFNGGVLNIEGEVTGLGNITTFVGTVTGAIEGSIEAGMNAMGIDTLSGVITDTGAACPVRIIGIFLQSGIPGDFVGEIITGPVPDYVESLTIKTAGDADSVAVDGTLLMTVEVLPTGASDEVIWSVYVNHRDFASIDEDTGLLTGLQAGVVTVIVKALDGSLEHATKNITVTTP